MYLIIFATYLESYFLTPYFPYKLSFHICYCLVFFLVFFACLLSIIPINLSSILKNIVNLHLKGQGGGLGGGRTNKPKGIRRKGITKIKEEISEIKTKTKIEKLNEDK